MALIKITDPITKETFEYYMDDKLKGQLDNKLIPALNKKDEDYVVVVDGHERSGKSVFSFQLGKYVDPTLSLDRVCFSPKEFRKAILGATKGQCVIYDEAYRGLSAKGALTEVNRILVSLMMEMGQKNLFVIINLPTFYLLEKYVALWRARGLFHVFRNKKGKKGYWVFYNKRKKQILFLKGKKDYSYRYVKSGFKGRFYNKYPINEEAYRKKKALSFTKGYKRTRDEKYMEQRDKLLHLIYKEYGLSLSELSNMCKRHGVQLQKTILSNIIGKFKERA